MGVQQLIILTLYRFIFHMATRLAFNQLILSYWLEVIIMAHFLYDRYKKQLVRRRLKAMMVFSGIVKSHGNVWKAQRRFLKKKFERLWLWQGIDGGPNSRRNSGIGG